MRNNIGATISLGGEKAFRGAISKINSDVKLLDSEMKKVTATFDKNDKSTQSLTQKNKILTDEIVKESEKIESLRKHIQELESEQEKSTKKVEEAKAEYEKEAKVLESLKNTTGATSKEIKDQESKVNILGNALKKADEEYTNGAKRINEYKTQMTNAETSVIKMNKAIEENNKQIFKNKYHLETIGKVLNATWKVTAGAVGAVGAGVAGAGTAIVSMAKKTSETSADINNMSQKVGMSVEGFQKWSYILSKSGTDASILQGGMKKLSDSVVKAGEGNDAAIEKFKKLGISVEELKGMNQEQIFERVVTGLQGMGEGAERTSLATSLLGKSATELGPLLNKDSSDMEKLTGNLNKYGLVMDEDVVKSNVAFKGSISNFQRMISATTNSLVSELIPGMSQVVDGFTDLIMGVDGADEKIKQGIENIAKGIDSALPKLIQMISDIVENMLKVAPEIISTLGTAIINELPKLVPTAVKLIVDLCRMIVDALPLLVQGAAQIIIELARGITQALPDLVPAIVDVVIEIVETLIDNVDMLLEAALEIILALAEGIFNALPRLIVKLPELVGKIVVGLIKCAGQLLKAAVEFVMILGKGILNSHVKIQQSIRDFMGKVVEFFKNFIGNFEEIGKNIIQGLWDGICAMGDWFKGKFEQYFGGIIKDVKDFLGIHSPSKVFFGIGENMGEGLELGFENSMQDMGKSIQNAIPVEFKTDLNASIRGAKAMTGMPIDSYAVGKNDVLNIILSELKNMNDGMYDKFVAALVRGVSISVDNREIARLVRRYA